MLRNVIIYNAAISACEVSEQSQKAFGLLTETREVNSAQDVTSYNAAISACEKFQQWQQVLGPLAETRRANLAPDVITTLLQSVPARSPSNGCRHLVCWQICEA